MTLRKFRYGCSALFLVSPFLSTPALATEGSRACLEIINLIGKFQRPASVDELVQQNTEVRGLLNEFISVLQTERGTGDSHAAARAFRQVGNERIWHYQTGLRAQASGVIPSDAVLRRMERLAFQLQTAPNLGNAPLALLTDNRDPIRSPGEAPSTRQRSRRELLVDVVGTAAGFAASTAANFEWNARQANLRARSRDKFLDDELVELKRATDALTLEEFRKELIQDSYQLSKDSRTVTRYPRRIVALAKQANFARDKLQPFLTDYRNEVAALSAEAALTDYLGLERNGRSTFLNASLFAHRYTEWTAIQEKFSSGAEAWKAAKVFIEIGVSFASVASLGSGFPHRLGKYIFNWRSRRSAPALPVASAAVDPLTDPISWLLRKSEEPAQVPFRVRWFFVGTNDSETDEHADIVLRVDQRTNPFHLSLFAVHYREREKSYWPPGASVREKFAGTPDSQTPAESNYSPTTPEAILARIRLRMDEFGTQHMEFTFEELIPFRRLMQRVGELKLSPNELKELEQLLPSLSPTELVPLQQFHDQLAQRRSSE